jgi:ribonucleoside-diphosphate reductase alpha chain
MESTNPCVTGDTRVWAQDEGWVPIRELVGRLPRVSTEDAEGHRFFDVTQVIRTGVKPILRLRTFEGYELRLTADHRVVTDSGDVPAGELGPGDRIRLLEAQGRVGDRDSRDARLGETVGWLVGDGHFTQHEAGKPTAVLSFYGEDRREAAPRILAFVREWIGDPDLGLNEVASRDLAYIRSQRLRERLEASGAAVECKSALPEIIWRGSAELRAGFLRGLFSADGGVQGTIEKGLSVRLASSSEPLLKDVQQLLLSLGIKSVIYRNRREAGMRMMPDSSGAPREYPRATQHDLVIARGSLRSFADSVGFLLRSKTDRLESALAGFRRGPYPEAFYATVEELVEEGEEEVFDLSEPNTRHFHANGILVHNCGEQPLLPYESCNMTRKRASTGRPTARTSTPPRAFSTT